jgi:hypothetical protein
MPRCILEEQHWTAHAWKHRIRYAASDRNHHIRDSGSLNGDSRSRHIPAACGAAGTATKLSLDARPD